MSNGSTDSRGWLTPAQSARVLGVTPMRVRQLMAEGKLEHQWTPLGRILNPDSVERLRSQRTARVAS